MEVQVKLSNLRISPRKVRLVATLIRGMHVNDAEGQLRFMKKASAKPILKLLKSAIATAENDFQLNSMNLRIKTIKVNEGSTLHRWRARAHGSAAPIKKKVSIIHIILEEIGSPAKKKITAKQTQKNEKALKNGNVKTGEKVAEKTDKDVKNAPKEKKILETKSASNNIKKVDK